jgi:succinate-semialdehyde dehydrogenase/glutarate-semialdehyde dehydrogenase
MTFATHPYHPDLYINGAFVPSQVGKRFDVTNPADGSVVGSVPDADVADTDAAIAAAHAAFPVWRAMHAKDRAKLINTLANLIDQNTDNLARLLTAEQGKPLSEAKSEISAGPRNLQWFAEEGRRVLGEYGIPHKSDARMIVGRAPVGVVAAITPWNFPVSMITRKIAPALAAGCTVVIKPAEDTPLCALALAELAHQAGFPPGVINVVTCSLANVPTVGLKLCRDPRVKKISFTGSTEVGRILVKQSADTLKRVSMELGGNAPFIVFNSADVAAAVDGIMVSKFRNAGQTCICANRIFVQDKIFDAVASALEAKIKAIKVGVGTEAGVTMGPLINHAAIDKVQAHVDDARGQGGTIVTGGASQAATQSFYQPTLVVGGHDQMLIAREETFGPVAALFPFKDEVEVVARANDTIYGLAAYFYTRDLGQAFRVSEGLDYGMVGVNEPLLSSELVPVGGMKQSGYGREGGHWAMDDFMDIKYTLMGGLGG